MRYVLAAVLFAGTAAHAQSIVDPAKLPPQLVQVMQDRDAVPTLECEVTPIRPALNFTFRFQSGYFVNIPLRQYRGRGNVWAVIVKITPLGGDQKPVFLASRIELPDIPETKVHGEIGGWYFLGEGRYQVEWTLVDNRKRSCRKDWSLNVELKRSERSVKVPIPPNTIHDLSFRRSTESSARKVRPARITVLLHAGPLYPRRTRLRPSDTMLLLGTLSSLTETLRVQSMKLVVFNLDQQTEVYRNDNFADDDLDDVAHSLNRLELGSIEYDVLQNQRGHLALLSSLVNRELEPDNPSDAVIFIGPTSRFSEKPAEGALLKPSEGAPDFFYFQIKPYSRRTVPFPDSIQYAVNALKGKNTHIYTPGDFAKAIEQLETRLPAAHE